MSKDQIRIVGAAAFDFGGNVDWLARSDTRWSHHAEPRRRTYEELAFTEAEQAAIEAIAGR